MRTPLTEAAALAAAWQRAYAGRYDKDLLPNLVGHQRSVNDARAAWQKWSQSQREWPHASSEQHWMHILERVRVETLASQELPGMAINLADVDAISPQGEAERQLYRTAKKLLQGGEAIPPLLPTPRCGHQASAISSWLPRIGANLYRYFGHDVSTRNQSPEAATLSEETAWAILQTASSQLSEPVAFSKTVYPLVQWLAWHFPLHTPEDPAKGVDADNTKLPHDDPQHQDKDIAEAQNICAQALPCSADIWSGYRVFSTHQDEIRHASSYLKISGMSNISVLSGPQHDVIRRQAHRLQQRLMAARLRTWAFDREEGRLDSRRLARLLIRGTTPTVFRQENEAQIPEACVTLLVDQSGSMNSLRRKLAAMTIDLAVRTLETCRINTEVLGFTTAYGIDSPLLNEWERAGSPLNPGRLNALRHVIYKPANQPWRHCRRSLELLLYEDFGKENIDGEALDWAARRLARRPEARKILIVLSDGSPYDAATCQAHNRVYLENHLRQVIAAIEESPIQLVGIGASQEVGRFYRKALILRQPDDVAQVLFEQLAALLTRPSLKG